MLTFFAILKFFSPVTIQYDNCFKYVNDQIKIFVYLMKDRIHVYSEFLEHMEIFLLTGYSKLFQIHQGYNTIITENGKRKKSTKNTENIENIELLEIIIIDGKNVKYIILK